MKEVGIEIIFHGMELSQQECQILEQTMTRELSGMLHGSKIGIFSERTGFHPNGQNFGSKKVLKSFPVKDKWKKNLNNFLGLAEEAKKLFEKAESFKKIFWGQVEVDTNNYGQMRLNQARTEIEVLDDKN